MMGEHEFYQFLFTSELDSICANTRVFTYPVLFDGECVGAIRLLKHEDYLYQMLREANVDLDDPSGGYIAIWIIYDPNPLGRITEILRKYPSPEYTVVHITYTSFWEFLVRDEDGGVFAVTKEFELIPPVKAIETWAETLGPTEKEKYLSYRSRERSN
jgi:hypothetical protein